MNKGVVYALWDYEAQNDDELSFREGDAITILRRQDDTETEWWWARLNDQEGYVPRNLLGVRIRGFMLMLLLGFVGVAYILWVWLDACGCGLSFRGVSIS